MVDWAAFAARVRGMLVAPDATFLSDGTPAPRWPLVLREHALPLIVPTSIVYVALLPLFLPAEAAAQLSLGLAVEIAIANAVISVITVFVIATVVRFFASRLGGRPDFDASFVLVALSTTPLFLGQAFFAVPGLGQAVAIIGLVWSLVLVYRGLVPVAGVPVPNRVRVFGLSLVTLFAIFVVLGFVAIMLLLEPA